MNDSIGMGIRPFLKLGSLLWALIQLSPPHAFPYFPFSRNFCLQIPRKFPSSYAVPHFPACNKMKYLKPLQLYRDVLKSSEVKRGRLLGLDVGDKYIGLSVSDASNKVASPLSVLVRKKSNLDLISTDFQTLISGLSLEGLVVGYPFDRQKSSPNSMHVKLFIDDLNKTGKFEDLKYTFWDECFTSKNVEFLLKPLPLHPVQFKTIMDKFAAVGILQGYLDFASRKCVFQESERLDQDDEIY